MPEIKLFESPSKLRAYDFCYLAGQLQYGERWEPKEAEPSLVARLRGNAISRAAEHVHKAIMSGERDMLQSVTFITSVIDEAVALFDKQWAYCLSKEITFPPNVEAVVRAELRRVIPLFARHTPVLQWSKVIGVEHHIKPYACRPDVCGVNAQQFHEVGDVKYKPALESRLLSNTVDEFHWDPQFQQYPEAFRHDQGLGEHDNVYSSLILVVGQPFRIHYIQWLYTPEQRSMFTQSVKDLTMTIREVEAGRTLPRTALTHRGKYGWCPMKKACLEYNLDPERMRRDYVQLDELPE